VSFFNIILLSAGATAITMVAIMVLAASARKSLRKNAENWFRANDLTQYMVTFTPGDAIGLNYSTKEAGFSSQGRNFKVSFSSLVSVEVVEDGTTINKTNRGNQLVGMAVGGTLLGGAGALIGGLSGSATSRQMIRKVSLHVITDSPSVPFIELRIFHDQAVQKGGFIYNQMTSDLMPWYGRLKAILETQ
jgi:hypothetical protein